MIKFYHFCLVFFVVGSAHAQVNKLATVKVATRVDLINLLPKNAVVAEIGVAAGNFSREILRTTNPSHLFLVDCWEDHAAYPESGYAGLYQGVIEQFKDNPTVTIIRQFSKVAAATFPDNFFDWVYIDANHSYEAVRDDLAAWLPKIKNGGFIAGHDYMNHAYFGVVRAVDEFVAKHNYTINYLATEWPPSYAIQVLR